MMDLVTDSALIYCLLSPFYQMVILSELICLILVCVCGGVPFPYVLLALGPGQ